MKHTALRLFAILLCGSFTVFAQFAGLTYATASSEAVRLDLREGFGGRVVRGTVPMSVEEGTVTCDGKAVGASWDTTKLSEGWHTLACAGVSTAVCVRNNVGIVLEEGRLTENTTWDGDAVHVVRNDVYVPRGVTLTLSAGAVVKFAEESRIIVEYGGKFSVQGSEESPVLFAMAGDDAVGGDTDLREEELEPIYSARIYCYETNGWEDNGWLVSSRVVISVLPNLAVKPVRAMRQGGMVRIPVTVSGTRNTPFWVAWEAVDGTAKYGVDYASKQGKVTWSSTSAGVAYVEVPLVTDAVSDGEVSFTMRLVRACGANIQTAEAVVTIYDNAESEFDALTHATATSEAVRLDLREDFGGRVVRGNVPMYTADGTVLLDGEPLDEAWDTTTVAEGWHTLAWSGESVEVCVRNDAGIALEEGRLAENTTWDNSAVRVVRNNVYVPNGVTLTITAGTTVKFAEDSRIIVENGGKLQMNGSEDAYVQFAMATDDGYAGDTDIEDAEVILPTAARIYNYSNGTVADNGFVASRGLIISTTYPSVAIHSAVAQEESGVVWLALTLSGTRKSSFYAEWEAFDDTATYGEDYTLASGRVTWTSTDNGTRYIQIPLTAGNLSSDEETFTVRLVASGGANISTSNTATVTIRKTAEYAVNDLTYSTALAEKARLDLRDGFGGSVVRGSVGVSQEEGTVMLDGVKLGEVWDTTVCADGWYNMVCGEKSREVVVLNDVAVSLEEGRLTANTTWDGSAVHLVRNDVYVPNGVTLTLAEGAVVKFTEDTRVIVENGGKVSVQGSAEAPVQFALISDDFFGGDTDLHDGEMDMPSRNLIYCYNTSNGWTDNGYFALREVAFNTLPTIAIHNSRAVEHEGFVAIPVTVSGTRKAAFSVDWSAQDGSAKLDTDYASTSGTLTWTSTDNGTRYINIPLVERDGQQALRDFTVTLDVAYATNIGNAVSTVSVFDSAASLPADAVYACANYTFDEPADLDERTDLFSRLAREVETLRYSTEWMESEHATAVRVTSQLDEEGLTPLDLYVSEPGETDGTVDWNTYSLGTGRYLLAHETLDERGGLLERLETNFFINREVIVHEGRLTGDETWDDSVVHVVRGNVIVPAGVQLIISDGAIVKFQDGCGIVAKLGCVVECKGATFTHIADDSVGGDTNLDGLNSIPSYDAYTVGGEGTIRMDTACKLLCKSATLPSGTLNRDTRLSGNLVYRATGNLTIARGITLTIEPGAVLKFDEGQGITVNGKLEAQGTHAQPIVFTSIKDDVHGGDTNQDGTNTWPEEGDWGGVIVNGGEAVLDNIMMEWGGYGQFTNQGDAMLGCNSGSLTLDNSHLAHSMLRLVNAAGTVNISNSVLEHGRFGIDGSATVINSVLAYCGDWTLSGNGSGNVINSIFYETASSSGYSSDYSCFYNAGRQLEGVGNLAADPLFNDPNSGDFTLKATSPCIDAGDGSVAPELDYWGKPRMNYTKINDTGVAAENGCVPDIGIYEFPGTGGGEVPDLQLNWVRGPAIAASGEMVTLAWQIENAGQTTIQGTWRDTIAAVSADENLGSQIVELGITSGYEMLTPGEKKTVIRQCRIPAMMPGNWRFAVTVNDNLDIYERNYLNNRQESEEGIEIQVSEWKSGKSYALASGEDIALLTTAQTILELVSQQSDGLTLRCGDGFLPTDAHFTSCARTLEDGRKLLVVPEMAGEGAFLRIANDSANGAVFGICKVSMAEAVCDVMPKALPAQVIATLSFILLDASKVKQVVLKQGDVSIAATGVSTDDQGRTVATFDLATAEAVNYDLEVTAENGMVYSVTDAVVVEETTKSAQLETWLDLPPTVRKGRQYIGYVCYKNSGNADRSAPVFRVIGKNGTQVKAKFSDKPNDVILLYGAGANPVNVLRAGQEARVPFYFSSLSDVGVDLDFQVMAFPEEEYLASATFATWKELETAVHKAAARMHERGTNETDFKLLREFAERMSVSEFSGICGRVYLANSHAPLARATLIAKATIDGEAMEFTAESDEKGYFCIDSLYGNVEYTVSVDFAYMDENYKVITTAGEDINDLNVLCTPWGNIRGYICMNDGQPIYGEDYSIELWLKDGTYALMTEKVDDNGCFAFKNLIDDVYVLYVYKNEEILVEKSEPIVVELGNVDLHALIKLGYPGSLRGTVVTDTGESWDNTLQVIAYGANGGEYRCEVAKDGNWEIPEIPSGVFSLEVDGQDWHTSERIMLGINEDEELDVGALVVVRKTPFIVCPSVGGAPLAVKCLFVLEDSMAEYDFAWDFDGDGVIDSTEPEPQWTYTELGEHAIVLTLTTPEGEVRQSEQTVTVIEPIENVLRDDVILIHEMKKPPYEFVSWDGTTLVMREVGEYPVKPVENAKMLFKYPDGDVIGVKILTSRKYGDCYYLTVDDATLTDFYQSFSFSLPGWDEEENEMRGEGVELSVVAFRGGHISTNLQRTYYDSPLSLGFDEKDEICYICYADGYILTDTITITDTEIQGGVGGQFGDSESQLKSPKEISLFKKPFLAGYIPCSFDVYVRIRGNLGAKLVAKGITLTFTQDISWYATLKKDFEKGWIFNRGVNKNCTSNISADTMEFALTGGVSVGLRFEVIIGGGSIKQKGGSSFKAEVAAGELDAGVDLSLQFDGTTERQKLSLGLHADASLALGKANVKIGWFEFNFTTYEKKLLDMYLWGRTWIWGGPVESFNYESTKYNARTNSYYVTFTTSGPKLDTLEKDVDRWGNHIAYYFPGKILHKRLWIFGDGESEMQLAFGSGGTKFTRPYSGESSHYVILQPYGLLGRGVKYGLTVMPAGYNQLCPKCLHVPTPWYVGCSCECHGHYDWDEVIQIPSPRPLIAMSIDPNEIVGPRGVGDPATQRLVAPGEWLDYTVYFENKATADAAAQEVWVDLDLDGSLVDLSTFQLGTVAFGSQQVNTLKGKALGKFAVSQDGTPWQVRGTVSYDAATGAAQWYLRSYDPANAEGGYWPAVTTAGFLPPNDDSHAGEGYVTFRVKVREDAPVGRRIDCAATITFDHNQPITTTPAWFNWIYDGGTMAANPPNTLAWDAVDGAEYDVTIWTGAPELSDEAAEIVEEFTGLTGNVLRLPAGLSADTTYYWQVTTTVDGTSTAGAVWSFELGARMTLRPADGWNLVSLPFPLDNYSEQVMLSRTMFEEEEDAYVRPLTLGIGRSYWLYQDEADEPWLDLFPSGELRGGNEPIVLSDGWNLVGPLEEDTVVEAPAQVWQFQDGAWRPLEAVGDEYLLRAGEGYMIRKE